MKFDDGMKDKENKRKFSNNKPVRRYEGIKNFFGRHENILASLIFFVALIIFFFPVVFFGKTLTTSIAGGGVMPEGAYGYKGIHPPMYAVRDPGAYNWVDEPLSEYIGRVIKNESRIPLWNPNMGFGYPILGGIQTGIFYPLNYIVFIFSSELAWDIYILLKFFLAGFLTYLFARKIGLDKKSGYLAGIAFMFNGYFINYLNMSHFSVEALTPLLPLAYEYFLSKPNIKKLLLCITSIALLILPGMPESSFFAILIGTLWFLFSYFFRHREQLKLSSMLFVLLGANIIALLLTSIQLLPFVELLNNSFNVHAGSKVGLSSIPFYTVLSALYPFLFNPIYNWLGQFHYVGLSVLALALIAVFSLRSFSKKQRNIILFFGIFTALGFAKVYGYSGVNWIGSLPVLDTLIFEKYGAPSVIFTLDILAAFGFSLLCKKTISFINTKLIATFIFIGSITVYAMYTLMDVFKSDPKGTNSLLQSVLKGYGEVFGSYTKFFDLLIPHITPPVFVGLNIILGLVIFILFYIIVLNTNFKKGYFTSILLLFVYLEFFLYALPLIRADRYDTYKEPPYISFLKSDKSEPFRIYGQAFPGQGVMLYPNISSVFGLQDIRFLIALGVNRYFDFIKNVLGVSPNEYNGVRFTGSFPLDSGSRFFGLMNVKYIIYPPGFGQVELLNKINNSKVVLSENKNFVGLSGTTLNTKNLGGLLVHAPSKMEFPLQINDKFKNLSFDYGIADTGVKKSDGVKFVASYQCGGEEKEAINDVVDPRNNKKYNSWQKGNLDLSECLGKEAKITFTTEDNGNNAYDHFFVGNFQSGESTVAYDKEVSIVKNEDYFPRAFVVHRVRKISEPDKIFETLKSPDFNLRNEIIIENDLPESQLNSEEVPAQDDSTVKMVDYHDEQIKMDVNMENPGFLVLLDQYYPGWKALVDGKETDIYPTDYVFRSVYLEKGSHKVEFIYDPLSYKIGKYITLGTILVLILAYIFRNRIDQRFYKKES